VSLAMMGLIAFAMTSIGLAMAWRTESTQGFHAFMNMLLLPIWMLSGAVFPVAGAPGWFQWTTRLNPLTYGVDALRQGLYLAEPASSGATTPMGSSVAIAIAFAAFSFILATRVARTASTI
jgi:ABC-2 type transport system permease protein